MSAYLFLNASDTALLSLRWLYLVMKTPLNLTDGLTTFNELTKESSIFMPFSGKSSGVIGTKISSAAIKHWLLLCPGMEQSIRMVYALVYAPLFKSVCVVYASTVYLAHFCGQMHEPPKNNLGCNVDKQFVTA